MIRFTPVVLNLVIINALVFLFQLLIETKAPSLSNEFLLHKSNPFGFRKTVENDDKKYFVDKISVKDINGNSYERSIFVEADAFRPLQLLTHFFSHGSFMHIFFNMFTLVMIGPLVEMVLGQRRFLEFYLFSGLVGGILITVFDPSITPVVGASGAVSGVFLAFAMLYPEQEMMLMFIPFPIKAKKLLIGFVVISLLLLFLDSNSGVSHFGHLAGMAAAYLYSVLSVLVNNLRK